MRPCILTIVLSLFCNIIHAEGPPPTPVKVTTLAIEELSQHVLVSGRVVARQMSVLSPKVAGEVSVMYKDVGDWVKEGELLMSLDSDLAQLKVDELESQLQLYHTDLKRAEKMSSIQDKEFDDLKKAAKAYQGSVSAKELRTEESKTVQLRSEVEKIKKQFAVTQSILEQQQLLLSYHQIKAPFEGQVLERFVEEGQWINAGYGSLRINNIKKLEVELDVPHTLFFGLQQGHESVEVTLSDYGKNFKLNNMRIRREVDPKSKTFVWIGEPQNPEDLVHGMSVEAYVPSSDNTKSLVVNYSAILKNDTGSYVYKLVPGPSGQIVVPIPVKLGFKKGDLVVLQSPALKQGDQIVVEGGERLFPMTPVKPLGE